MLNIACLVFDGFTALSAIGPYQVLTNLPNAQFRFVAPERGQLRSDDRLLTLSVDDTIDDMTQADLLIVPGGFGTRRLMQSERVLSWLREIDARTQITASVCTGALLLAAAGLLRGRRANTQWAVREQLAQFGAVPSSERYVRDGKYACAAGTSAGIDLALSLAIELSGPDVAQSIQLMLEYDPRAPLDTAENTRPTLAPLEKPVQRH